MLWKRGWIKIKRPKYLKPISNVEAIVLELLINNMAATSNLSPVYV